jgi:hypothetical protein
MSLDLALQLVQMDTDLKKNDGDLDPQHGNIVREEAS